MFQGASALMLDATGLVAIPARYREMLRAQAGGRVTMTRHPEAYLLLFPRPDWEVFRTKVAALPMGAHWWRRVFLGNAVEADLDVDGRVRVSPELRHAARLETDIMLLGMGSHLELWDAQTYTAREEAARAPGMPEALKGFTF